MELAAQDWGPGAGREAEWEGGGRPTGALWSRCALLFHTELTRGPRTYVFEEEVKFPVILGVDGSLEEGQEDVLQHLPKVWQ